MGKGEDEIKLLLLIEADKEQMPDLNELKR
jgi:hypothetical protein